MDSVMWTGKGDWSHRRRRERGCAVGEREMEEYGDKYVIIDIHYICNTRNPLDVTSHATVSLIGMSDNSQKQR